MAGREGPLNRSGLVASDLVDRPEPAQPGPWPAGHLAGPRGGGLAVGYLLSVVGDHELSFQNGPPGGAWP